MFNLPSVNYLMINLLKNSMYIENKVVQFLILLGLWFWPSSYSHTSLERTWGTRFRPCIWHPCICPTSVSYAALNTLYNPHPLLLCLSFTYPHYLIKPTDLKDWCLPQRRNLPETEKRDVHLLNPQPTLQPLTHCLFIALYN